MIADRAAVKQSLNGVGYGSEGLVLGELAKPRRLVAVGTKPLPRKGRNIRTIGVLLAVSTLWRSPSATASQISARANRAGSRSQRASPAARRWSGTRGRTRPR